MSLGRFGVFEPPQTHSNLPCRPPSPYITVVRGGSVRSNRTKLTQPSPHQGTVRCMGGAVYQGAHIHLQINPTRHACSWDVTELNKMSWIFLPTHFSPRNLNSLTTAYDPCPTTLPVSRTPSSSNLLKQLHLLWPSLCLTNTA